jgi:hypothetical protein
MNVTQLYLHHLTIYWGFLFDRLSNRVSTDTFIEREVADVGGLIPTLTSYNIEFYKGYLNAIPDRRQIVLDYTLSPDGNICYAEAIRLNYSLGGYVEYWCDDEYYWFRFKY